jgi:hypothetical protein
VLPDFDTMTPALLTKVKDLVEKGATVVGSPPSKSPSLSGYPDCDREVQSIASDLWGEDVPPSEVATRKVGLGRMVWGGDLLLPESEDPHRTLYPDYEATARVLFSMGIPPDFESEGPIRYTHRRTESTDIFFVANRSDQAVEANCLFRVAGKTPELWDPVTGGTRALSRFEAKGERTSVPIRFEPHQSFFVVFGGEGRPRPNRPNAPVLDLVQEIEGPWEVAFDSDLGGPGEATFETLSDWTENSDPGIRFFSGIATYRRPMDLPEGLVSEANSIWLDIGEVPGMARVRLNGKDLGVLWCAPWRVEITEGLQSTGNELEIEVANLWPNRLIGDRILPPEKQIAWTTWNPYEADSPLLPSGLMGPVRILMENRGEEK